MTVKSSTIGRGLVRPSQLGTGACAGYSLNASDHAQWDPRCDGCSYRVFVLTIMFGWDKKPFDAMDPELR